jgi:hypothetical protein
MSQSLADEFLRDVTNGNHATSSKDDAIDFGGFVGEPEDAAGCSKLGDLIGSEREPTISQTKKYARVRVELVGPTHIANSSRAEFGASGRF